MTRQILVGALMALAIFLLSACGVTSWQRHQDALADLHSPEMQKRIEEARNWK